MLCLALVSLPFVLPPSDASVAVSYCVHTVNESSDVTTHFAQIRSLSNVKKTIRMAPSSHGDNFETDRIFFSNTQMFVTHFRVFIALFTVLKHTSSPVSMYFRTVTSIFVTFLTSLLTLQFVQTFNFFTAFCMYLCTGRRRI